MPRKRIPWPPKIPARLRKGLALFTAYAGGWCRWHDGRMVHICGRATPLEQVDERWRERKKKLGQTEQAAARQCVDGPAYCEAASEFFKWLDNCRDKGRPKRLAPVTVEDYKREVNNFGAFLDPDRAIRGVDTDDFTDYAKTFDDNAPATLARVVACLTGFFQWCKTEKVVVAVPEFGNWFVKPPQQDKRDKRLGETKSYTAAQFWRLWALADTEAWAWMSLAITGAYDNSDIAHLTFDVLDRTSGAVDYRRRKRGKRQRVVPLPAWAWRALDAYLKIRPQPVNPEHADLVFLTPTGLPLQRMTPSPTRPGENNSVDYVAMKFGRLMIHAGLKPPLPAKRRTGRKGKPDDPTRERKVKAKGSAAGQGFRAIRTTWGNLVPPSYGDEREIIMGHHEGDTFVENYLERIGLARLEELVAHVWSAAFTPPPYESAAVDAACSPLPGEASPSASPSSPSRRAAV